MAARQEIFLSFAYGPADPALLSQRINYTASELKKKIRSTAYGSFSLFGLAFIFSVGGSLVATSYLLEPVSKYLYEKKGYKKYEHLEWTSNATLQLQRLAHEEAGFGNWSHCTDIAPNTEANDLLGSLDITNPDHPILRRLSRENSPPDDSQSDIQIQDKSSPTITPGSLSLQSTRPHDSEEGVVELLQARKPTPGSETSQEITEPQVNGSLPQSMDPPQGEEKAN
ncbi:hypothetical protein F5Y14DRAFT_451603 [Nemania sp. NC0429]|nr:hypothetical protein F5Y14DRAFT_451603 [Nemania sp. NC0429]